MGVVASSPEASRRAAIPRSSVHRGKILPIVTYPSPVLREECGAVPREDFGAVAFPLEGGEGAPPPPPALAPWLDELVRNMRATVAFQDALGLAAPQVGVKTRVFVMRRPKTLLPQGSTQTSFEVCINPRVRNSKDREIVFPEGCLSIPAYEAFVRRKHTITAEWFDEGGAKRTAVLQGLPAAVFQHELDHLDGVLLLDREILDMRGTPAAGEADRRFDEELERHYIVERPASRSRRGRRDHVHVDEF